MAADSRKPGGDRAADAIGLARCGRDESIGGRPRSLRHGDLERDPRQDAPRGEPGGRTHRGGVLLPRHGRIAITLSQAQPRDVPRHRRAAQRCARPGPLRRRQPARPAGRGGRRRAADPGAHREGPENSCRREPAERDDGLSGPCGGGAGVVSMILLRSLAFAVAQILITPPYSIVALATFPLPRLARYRVISGWSHLTIWLAKHVLGIDYRVVGQENLPKNPAVILSKHQSAWETLAFQVIFPPQVLVLKRELLWIPFFGWGLALTSPIAIDRGSGVRALKRMAELGRERLAQGFWIAIFPEGTRVKPGERGKYHEGGAWLAVQCGALVVPVAHNAGLLWSRNAFLKRAGTVTVEIGAPIDSRAHSPESLNKLVEKWIEDRMGSLCPRR